MTESDVRQLVAEYMAGLRNLDSLEGRLLDLDISDASALSNRLMGLLSEASHAHWNEKELREELDNASRPFASWTREGDSLFVLKKRFSAEPKVEANGAKVLRKPLTSEALGTSAMRPRILAEMRA